jgi:hypothetical protein
MNNEFQIPNATMNDLPTTPETEPKTLKLAEPTFYENGMATPHIAHRIDVMHADTDPNFFALYKEWKIF